MAKERKTKIKDMTDEEYQQYYEDATRRESRGLRILTVIFCLLQFGLSALLGYQVFDSGFLPLKLMVILAAALCLALLIVIWLVSRRRRGWKVIGLLLSLLVILVLGVLNFYMYRVNDTLHTVTDSDYKIDNMIVVVRKDDPAETINDAAAYTFGISTSENSSNVSKMKENIEDTIGNSIKTEEFSSAIDEGIALVNGEVDAVIYNKAYNDIIVDHMDDYNDQVRILYTYEVKTVVETQEDEDEDDEDASVDKPFNVFISGIDAIGSISSTGRSDMNIIMTVNPKTHTILLTHTPRDYYVVIPGISGTEKDKLTHAGIYGIDASIRTLESIYDTDIDYYVRVNFTTVETLVDALGGIDVESEYEFNTYYKGYHISKGTNHLNGDQTIGYVRERFAFPDGDSQRGRNLESVIEIIFDKLTSPAGITGAGKILSGLKENMETNFSEEEIAQMINRQISEGTVWTFEKQSVTGTDDMKSTYSGGSQPLYVMQPDEASVAKAAAKIKEVLEDDSTDSGDSKASDEDEEKTELPFTDVTPEKWYYEFVKDVYEKGLMSGVDEITFAPNEEVTRLQACVILNALAGNEDTSGYSVSFDDVPADAWYYGPVAWAYSKGYIDSATSTAFYPERGLTRADLALMLYRYAGSPEVTGDIEQFTDASKISEYYRDAIIWATTNGVMSGSDDGSFQPNEITTRVQMAVILSEITD